MSVSICPVCKGKGRMNKSFYPDELGTGYMHCRSCDGDGVIKSDEIHHHHYPAPYHPPRPEPRLPQVRG